MYFIEYMTSTDPSLLWCRKTEQMLLYQMRIDLKEDSLTGYDVYLIFQYNENIFLNQ